MKWPFFSRSKPQNNDSGLIERYKQLRALGLQLNMVLVKQLPKVAVPECGKKLGIFKAGTLILNNDDEIAILYDYCLHHYRRDGKTVIDRHLANAPPQPGTDEAVWLQAMTGSYYSVFKITGIHPHKGAELFDLINGKTLSLIDLGLSQTGQPGIILAGRILPFADFNMSSGTLIPLPEEVFQEKIKPVIRKFLKSDEPGDKPPLSSGQSASLTAEIIRVALHEGGADNVFYTDVEH